MSTILSVTAHGTHPPRVNDDGVLVCRAAFSIDGYSPVMVTIRVLSTRASLTTTCLPDGIHGWWREPTAPQRRAILDQVLAGQGLVRDGRESVTTADGWHRVYPIAKACTADTAMDNGDRLCTDRPCPLHQCSARTCNC